MDPGISSSRSWLQGGSHQRKRFSASNRKDSGGPRSRSGLVNRLRQQGMRYARENLSWDKKAQTSHPDSALGGTARSEARSSAPPRRCTRKIASQLLGGVISPIDSRDRGAWPAPWPKAGRADHGNGVPREKSGGLRPAALYGPGGRDDEPGHLAPTGEPYGLAQVCRARGLVRSTVYCSLHQPAKGRRLLRASGAALSTCALILANCHLG